MKWIKISRELKLKTFLFNIFTVGYKSLKSGKEGRFDVLETKDWANIIAITNDSKVVMVEQFRFGSAEVTLEFPAGAIEELENPVDSVKRELIEETGRFATNITQIGECRPNPAFLNNTCHHFLSENLETIRAQKLDEHEEISIKLIPINEIESLIKNGTIKHSLAISAWYFYKLLK